jgi:hypothetical protein
MLTRDRSTLAGTLMIVSGIFTVLASAGAFFGLIWFCVGAFWLFPLIIGIGEIAVGTAIMGGVPNQRVRAMSAFGILAALLCGNLIGVGLEIAALVLVSKSEPKGLLG